MGILCITLSLFQRLPDNGINLPLNNISTLPIKSYQKKKPLKLKYQNNLCDQESTDCTQLTFFIAITNAKPFSCVIFPQLIKLLILCCSPYDIAILCSVLLQDLIVVFFFFFFSCRLHPVSWQPFSRLPISHHLSHEHINFISSQIFAYFSLLRKKKNNCLLK